MVSKEKCEIFMDRIDEILIFIVDVEVIRKVNVCMSVRCYFFSISGRDGCSLR